MIPSMASQDGRRAWAFLGILGGCIVMTAFAAFGVWYVRGDNKLTFYLALAAHAQILVGLTALGAQFNRKMTLDVGPTGIKLTDSGNGEAIKDGDQVTINKDAP